LAAQLATLSAFMVGGVFFWANRYTAVMRRPQISLRWLLILFTVLSVSFYVLFIRPTALAKRFVRATNSGDFSALKTMSAGSSGSMLEDLQSWHKDFTFENCKVSAEVKPRTWRDIYMFRRKVNLHIAFPPGVIKAPDALENFLVVHINSITWGEEP
jgi:hypothetical protein